MSRPGRLLLILLAGLLLLGAVGALLWSLPPIPADAQGVGIFGTSATGTRTNCTQITNPVVGQTFCFDQAANVLKYYTGTGWQQALLSQQGYVNAKDFGVKCDGATNDTAALTLAIQAATASGANGLILMPGANNQTCALTTVPASAAAYAQVVFVFPGNGDFSGAGAPAVANKIQSVPSGGAGAVFYIQNNSGADAIKAVANGGGFAVRAAVNSGTGVAIDAQSVSTTQPAFVARSTGYYAAYFEQLQNLAPSSNNTALNSLSQYGYTHFVQQGADNGTLVANSVNPAMYAVRNISNLNGFDFTAPIFRIESTSNVASTTGGLMDAIAGGTTVYSLSKTGTMSTGVAAPLASTFVTLQGSTVNAGLAVYNTQGAGTDGASTPLYIAARNAATTPGNVSIEALTNTGAAPDMLFRTGGSGTAVTNGTERLRLGVAGGVQLGAPASGDKGIGTLNVATAVYLNGTQTLFNGTPTNAVRCTNNCGLSPSIVGTNSAMRVTMGATGTPATPFLVLFSGTWTATPSCIAQIDTPGTTAATVTRANASTTGVQVNTVVNPPNSAVYSIHCLGVG